MKISKEVLLLLLEDMRKRIEANDSFEGSVEYSCMQDECEKNEFVVKANYRIGNTNGQGGMRTIG